MSKNKNQLKLSEKPLFFLSSFGHCGIDWVHSLIDSHPQVLILPAFSFHRSWNMIQAEKAKTSGELFSVWKALFDGHKYMQVKRRKLLYDDEQKDIFYASFKKNLEINGIDKKSVFWAIHQAYCEAWKIDLDNISIIVAQEHLPFYFEEIIKDFPDSKFLLVARDPRATVAGAMKGNENDEGFISDYSFNLLMEHTLYTQYFWQKHYKHLSDSLKIVTNEDLHADLEKHMRDLATWLGIEFHQNLLECSFSGIPWVGESSYIEEEEKYPEKLEIFYKPENIRKRWMGYLTGAEIRMIETLTSNIMDHFGYDRIYKKGILNRSRGLFSFLFPHYKLFKKWKVSYPDIPEFERITNKLGYSELSRIWQALPTPVKFICLIVYSMISRVIVLRTPGNASDRYV